MLIDPRGLPPHEALSNKFPQDVIQHGAWAAIKRIFRVGFQPSVNQRFQSAPDLILRLDEIISPQQGNTNRPGYQDDVDAIRDLLQSSIAESIQQIEESMYVVSKKLLEKIGGTASESGLGVSTGDYIDMGNFVVCHFSLHVPRRGVASEQLFHRIELERPSRSFVAASYQLGQEIGGSRVTYYRGPAADGERLEEEVLSHADEMFKIIAADLRQKLDKASI